MTDLRPLRRAAALIALAGAVLASQAAPAGRVPLRLIGINDFHGNLEAANLSLTLADPAGGAPLKVPAGGAAAVAGMVNALRAGAPQSLMLSGGDLISAAPLVSTLFRHESTVRVMNAIGLDVSTVGNHEFDNGSAELKRIAAGGCAPNPPQAIARSCADGPYPGARFPYLSANVRTADGGTLFAPFVVRRIDGIRVGIIGAVTRTTPSIVIASGVAGLSFGDEADAINRAARKLRAQGVRAIVLTIHEGGEVGPPQQRGDWNDTAACTDAHGAIFDMARRITKDVGVIFSAHTHQGYRCRVDGRWIVQGTSYGRGLSVVDTVLDRRTRSFVPALATAYNLPVLNDATPPEVRERLAAAAPSPWNAILRDARADPAIAAQVAAYAAQVAPIVAQPVGTIGGDFPRAGHGEVDSAAGRLIADSQLDATRAPSAGAAEIALMNAGGIRADLECRPAPPCTATFGQLFTMQPFANQLVTLTLTGAQLRAVLESQQKPGETEPKFLQPSTGLAYVWRADAPAGERVRDLVVDGRPVVPEQRLRITVNNFLAEGGDGFGGFTRGTDRTLGPIDLDALVAYLKAGERAPVATPRVTKLP